MPIDIDTVWYIIPTMRKHIAAFAAFLALSVAAHAQSIPTWTTSTETLTFDTPVFAWQLNSDLGIGIYEGAHGMDVTPIPHDEWGYIYVGDLGIPIDVKSVTFIGQMLISHGGPGNRHCDLYLYMNDDEQHYGQVVEWHAGGSPRQNFAAVAPVHNGMISLRWRAANPSTIQYPGMPFTGNCNYGIFLRIAQAAR